MCHNIFVAGCSNRSVGYRDMVVTYFVFEIIERSNEKIFCFSLMNLKFVTYCPFPDVIKDMRL